MLLGCGCQCEQGSISSAGPTSGSLQSLSQSFPSYSNYPNSTGVPVTSGCIACEALAATSSYMIYIDGMTEQQPSLFGDWGCLEMLTTPYVVYRQINGDQQNQKPPIDNGLMNPEGPKFCRYSTPTDALEFPGTPPAGWQPYYQPGSFYHKHIIGQPQQGGGVYRCGDVPDTELQLVMYDYTSYPNIGKKLYQVWLRLKFDAVAVNLINGPPVQGVFCRTILRYSTALMDEKILCLNWMTLDWVDTQGSLERQAPGGGWESYGFGPGNNFSYQFDRGDFPQQIRVRPL